MTLTLSQSGATSRIPAYAVAQQARANWAQATAMAAADRMHVDPTRVVRPTHGLVETPEQIREQVMADRGVSRRDLVQLSAQARLEAELSIDAETRERARQANIKTQGAFVDLRA